MNTRFLDVPFRDKETAKRLGAKWDYIERRWYVPKGLDERSFSKWLLIEPTIKADHCYLLSKTTRCWKCASPTEVFAIGVPEQHFYQDSDPYGDKRIWITASWKAILFHVNKVNRQVFFLLREKAPGYSMDSSKQHKCKYLMNHCDSCGIKIGDFAMHCEPGGEFWPINNVDLTLIRAEKIDKHLEADASFGSSDTLPFISAE